MTAVTDQIRSSLGSYVLASNRGYTYVPFHQELIIPALEKVASGEITRLMINMPPRHGKTDIATLSFIPFWIGLHPQGNAMVVSYSYELAKDFGSKIKARMETPLYLKLFPHAKLAKDVRSRNFMRTISGGSFYALGFDGAMSGKGINLAVLDDAIKNHEEAESDTRQQFLMDIYESTIKARLEPSPDGFKPAMIIAMTRWELRDFCGRVLDKEGRKEEGGDWTVLTLPAEAPDGTYLWEDRLGRKHYDDAKRDDDTWSALYQQNPAASKSFWFKEQNLNFYDIPPRVGQYKTYLLCDPGATKERKSDRTSIQVYAAGQDRKLFLVDWVLDRMHPGERQKALERLIRRWTPELNLYEEYGLVNDAYYFNQAAEEHGFDAVLTPVGKKGPRHNLSKEARIDGLKTWYEEGRIILPRRFDYTMTNGEKVDLVKRFIKEEYSVYKGKGSVPFEDDLDAQARINDIEPPYGPGFEWHVTEPEQWERPTRGHGSSWESVY